MLKAQKFRVSICQADTLQNKNELKNKSKNKKFEFDYKFNLTIFIMKIAKNIFSNIYHRSQDSGILKTKKFSVTLKIF